MDVGQDEEAGDTFVFQEATAEAKKQHAGTGKDISELLRDSEGEVKPVVEPQATRRTRATIVKTSESKPEEQPQAQLSIPRLRATPSKKRTKAQAVKSSKSSAFVAEASRKKQKASSE
ncbi:hypothetical protein ACFX15_037162 [Malus domestica]